MEREEDKVELAHADTDGSDTHPESPASKPHMHGRVAPRRRRVSFTSQSERDVIPAASSFDQLDDSSDLWYTRNDLTRFRDEARDLCSLMQTAVDPMVARDDEERATKRRSQFRVLLAVSSFTRGLEIKVCRERQARKTFSIRMVVLYSAKRRHQSCVPSSSGQKVGYDEDELAHLYERCTAWARKLALTEAERDYKRAYEPTSSASAAAKKLINKRRYSPVVKPRFQRRASSTAAVQDVCDL